MMKICLDKQSRSCQATTIQVEVVYIIYECDLNHKYKILISNGGDMFEWTIPPFVF